MDTYVLEGKLTNFEIIVKIMYYSFTTLSTVGFGDIRPINSSERLVCAMIMLIGVSLFSLIMSKFLNIIQTFKKIDEEVGDQDRLESFFHLLVHKNKNIMFN